jgi:hypothetical protein
MLNDCLVVDTDGSELLLLEWSHELPLLFDGLKSTVSEFGGGIDGFEVDLFQIFPLVVNEKWFSEENWSLSDSHAGTFDHQEIVLDLTVMREATNWIDGFLGEISLGGTVVEVDNTVFGFVAGAESVDLLVDLNSMVVTFLTSSSNGVRHSRWMPGSDTGDLSETSMSFSGKFLGTPSAGDTFSSVTLGDSDAIGVIVGGEDGGDWDLLFKETSAEVDFGGGVATVDLKLDDMGFLLLEWDEFHLGVGDESDNLAVFLDLVQTLLLAGFGLGPFLLVFSESQFLGFSPVFVESPFSFVTDMFSPDGLEGSETSWGLDVTNNTDSDHWWAIDDGDWLDDFFLVELVSLSGDFSNDVGHTGLVSDESGQVGGLGFVILWV